MKSPIPILLLLFLSSCSSGPRVEETAVARRPPVVANPAARVLQVRIEDGLTIEEAIELALAKNPQLLTERRELDFALAQRTTAGQWAVNPILETGAGRALPFTGTEDYGVRIGVTQEFELGGKRQWRIEVAEANLERVVAGISDAERTVRADVAATYYESVMWDQLVSLRTASEEIAVRLLEASQAMFDANQIPEVELDLVRLQRQRTRDENMVTSARRRAARLRLAALLGEPSRADLLLVGSLAADPESPDREQLLTSARELRPDLVALWARVRAAEAQIRLEEARVWPNPEFGLFYERDAQFIDQSSSRDDLLGFELRVPIPFLNRRRGEIEQARSELFILQASLADLDRQIERDIDLALTRLELAEQRVEIYEQELNRLSESNVQQLERAFRAGEVGTLEVLRAQEDYNRITVGYQEALLEHRVAEISLESVTGGIVPDTTAPRRDEQ